MLSNKVRASAAALLAGVTCVLFTGRARAQSSEVLLSTQSPTTVPYLSGSGRVVLVYTTATLSNADNNDVADLYLYDRDAPGWQFVPQAPLLKGVPSFYAKEITEVTPIGLSRTGRYIGYSVSRRLDRYAGYVAAVGRYDTQTGDVAFAYVASGPSGPGIGVSAMSADASTFAWLRFSAADRVDIEVGRLGEQPRIVGQSCVNSGGFGQVAPCQYWPALSATGDKVLYVAGPQGPAAEPEALAIVDTLTGARQYYPEFRPAGGYLRTLVTNGTATFVGAVADPGRGGVFDVVRRRLDGLDRPAPLPPLFPVDVSDDGTLVLTQEADSRQAVLYDRVDGTVTPLGSSLAFAPGLSDDGSTVLTVQFGDQDTTEVRVWTLDADNDGMTDAWERRYGLSPSNAADAALDSDGDGRTNLEEFAVRSHPAAVTSAQRVFAEGAGGRFFDTLVHIFNPGSTPANVVVGYLGADGSRTSRAETLAPKGRTSFASCCVATLDATEFSIVVESDAPITAEREMYWDRTRGYGSHATAGSDTTAREWYFAEGATIGDLQLFYLLANPGDADAVIDIEYLLASGSSVTRRYVVPARSRRTIWVNQEGAPLDRAEIAAHVMSTQPIVAERATYLTRQDQTFAAGSASIGVQAPATTWTFAEGATGPFFDTFVLLANPLDEPAQVVARYQLPTGTVVSRSHVVGPRSRLTIWVDREDDALADTAVTTTVTADVPIVAERAMWWPGPTADTWMESHTEVGATAAGTRWSVAAAAAGAGAPASTFLLLGNATEEAGRARITLYNPSGSVAATREYDVAPTSRTTAWLIQDFPGVLPGTYSAIVEALPLDGRPPVAIVVERASYTPDLAAGMAVAGTRLAP